MATTQEVSVTLYCQTRTGAKVHRCLSRSSRTYCGVRVARVWPEGKLPGEGAHFCGGCGKDSSESEIK